MESREQKKERLAVEGAENRKAYQDEQKRINDNMLRLRAGRVARETLPETQGEKTKPLRPECSSETQNKADRP